jgi:hypothetical protein
MADNQPLKAMPFLEKAVIQSPDADLKNKSKWYLALATLKAGNANKARQLLNEIINETTSDQLKSNASQLRAQLTDTSP